MKSVIILLVESMPKSIRNARLNDSILFYLVRYSEDAIKWSKIKNIPSFSEHDDWFKNQDLNNFYVIQENDAGVGYVRINNNEVSIAILPMYKNSGYASFGLSEIIKLYPNLKAEIYKDNIASIRLFNKFPEIKVVHI